MNLIYIIAALVLFTSSPILSQTKRQPGKIITVPKQIDPHSLKISAYNNKIMVTNAPVGSTLEIYSVVGIKVKEIKIKQSTAEYSVNIAKGYYIIRIDDTVRKIAIR